VNAQDIALLDKATAASLDRIINLLNSDSFGAEEYEQVIACYIDLGQFLYKADHTLMQKMEPAANKLIAEKQALLRKTITDSQ
jgi:hypothetical protein